MKALLLVGFLGGLGLAQAPKTVLDGVYTADQADRGKEAYAKSCAACHRADMGGFSAPPLKGDIFLDRWREFKANVLYELIRVSMPKDASSPLPDSTYLDIFSHILRENEIPAGKTPLTTAILDKALLVSKLGPQPLPSSSQVGVVDCFTLDVGNGWFVTMAGEPFRTLDSFDIPAAEIEEAKALPPGPGLFRLQNITDLPNLDMKSLENNKVEVKGILVRAQKGERINVTAVKLVSQGCGE